MAIGVTGTEGNQTPSMKRGKAVRTRLAAHTYQTGSVRGQPRLALRAPHGGGLTVPLVTWYPGTLVPFGASSRKVRAWQDLGTNSQGRYG